MFGNCGELEFMMDRKSVGINGELGIDGRVCVMSRKRWTDVARLKWIDLP